MQPSYATPTSARLYQSVIKNCCKPSDQPRDAARREECSDRDEKSLNTFVVVMGGRKGLLESTKMDFMRL